MIPAAQSAQQRAPRPIANLQTSRWQQLWRDAVRDPRELLSMLGLEGMAARISDSAAMQFPLRVPRGFVARMRQGDPHDPLLRQVLPIDDEDRIVEGFTLDAVGDAAARSANGVLQKYQGRALLVATGSCAIHCRYCFRRHFPYSDETAARAGWQEAIATIRNDASVDEVILSGGDPLSLATSKLVELTDALAGVPHIKRLRIHSRLPVVLPERIDAGLLSWLDRLPWPTTLVIHANHTNEFDGSVDAALAQVRKTGITVLNQAVLLRGVNDSVDALAALSERSFAAGALPYYLHQLDRVSATAHFEISDDIAQGLHAALAARLSGYLVPRLVREIAGDPGKRPL
ncbi:MAG: EF-P beta-lysylation protein EpmB [Lysobacter sp.]|nr:EF-P beta-lysylation protein EpmB [Lysobacter sp.]